MMWLKTRLQITLYKFSPCAAQIAFIKTFKEGESSLFGGMILQEYLLIKQIYSGTTEKSRVVA